MAVIRNTAAMQYRGRVGNTTFYVEAGRQLARVSQNSSNYGDTATRTEAQQVRRAAWANLVNFYKLSKSWMRKAYESKTAKQSDYNRFMQLNLANARVYLTKSMYQTGGCVVDAFKVSEGSLRSIAVSATGNAFATDLALGSLTLNNDTTIADFSTALIRLNSHVSEGMQISFVSYQQELNAYEVPLLMCTAYEVTLNKSSNAKVRDYLPEYCCCNVDGNLGTNANISTGAFAYILSDSTSGRTLVSTQSLVVKNATLLSQYTTRAAREASVESYGVNEDVFLMSGSRSIGSASQPVYIEAIKKGSFTYAAGNDIIAVKTVLTNNTTMRVVISGEFEQCTSAAYWTSNDVPPAAEATSMTKDGQEIVCVFPDGSYVEQPLWKIILTIDGKDYTALFHQEQINE